MSYPWRRLMGVAVLIILVAALWLAFRQATTGVVGMVTLNGLITEDRPVIQQLHRLADHPRVKAIVLHLNTPGGTVASSQSISEDIGKLKKTGLPIVASMAEVCTSGGYYIACQADRVVAMPGTITGSIGVILKYPEAGELLRKLGVRMEVVQSGEYKNLASATRPLSAGERTLLQDMIDDVYAQFVDAVLNARAESLRAAGERRNGTGSDVKAYLESLADGRIFSGRQAQALGLVDELGNLDDAVAIAANLGGISGRPRVLDLRPRGWLPILLQHLSGAVRNGPGLWFASDALHQLLGTGWGDR